MNEFKMFQQPKAEKPETVENQEFEKKVEEEIKKEVETLGGFFSETSPKKVRSVAKTLIALGIFGMLSLAEVKNVRAGQQQQQQTEILADNSSSTIFHGADEKNIEESNNYAETEKPKIGEQQTGKEDKGEIDYIAENMKQKLAEERLKKAQSLYDSIHGRIIYMLKQKAIDMINSQQKNLK